jgi:hypothetical protein
MQILSTEISNDVLSMLQAVTFFACLIALGAWAYYAKLNRDLLRYMVVPISYLVTVALYYILLALVTATAALDVAVTRDLFTIASALLRLMDMITWILGALAMLIYFSHRIQMAEIEKARRQALCESYQRGMEDA